jgi:hypothetical protein
LPGTGPAGHKSNKNIRILNTIIKGDTLSFHLIKSCYNISLAAGQTDSVIVEFFPETFGS